MTAKYRMNSLLDREIKRRKSRVGSGFLPTRKTKRCPNGFLIRVFVKIEDGEDVIIRMREDTARDLLATLKETLADVRGGRAAEVWGTDSQRKRRAPEARKEEA